MTLERFHFTGNDGKDYTLPTPIPSGALRKSRKAADPLDQIFTVLEAVADEATLDALDALPPAELAKVARDWMQGMTAGESSGSSS